mmetsp:Transcript_16206/g.41936  ORF Transcript_16206/g.41936 Transcript_16206/m.41936 type:complete len:337 (-) Transcript_16206:253-1263(-)
MAPAHLLLQALAAALLADVGRADLQLLQWNPHWQCFAWNENNCTEHAQSNLNSMLQASDIDFANIIEFEVDNLTLLEPWTSMRSDCGHDRVDLVYSTSRWRPSSQDGASVKGCMVPADRPFIVQKFNSISNSSGTPSVIVIGAHFPHPQGLEDTAVAGADVLKAALQSVMANTTDHQPIVLIADTNEWNTVPSKDIMAALGVQGGNMVSTSLERTCCYDVGFPYWGTFDRIIANFGSDMVTTVFHTPLPAWAEQVREVSGMERKGAFHKAIKGTLVMGHSHGMRNGIIIIIIAIVVAMVLIAGTVAAACICRGGDNEKGVGCDHDSESDSTVGRSE